MTRTPVPHSGCYWVVPGKFLAGNYPGEKEAARARLKLGGILDHGVRTFINLMQPEDRNHSGLPFTPYADIADALASEQGFTLTHQSFPIQDQGIPDTDTMHAVLEAIEANLQQDRPVYLHCWGGHGRTGTVVGCYLIAHGLATKDNFVEVIAQLRKHVPTHISSPENSKQRDFVRTYDAPRASDHDTAEADRFLGCLLAANLGDDADTTAAIYGQIAGAYCGSKAIPEEWRDKVYMRELIEDYAGQLYAMSQL